MKMKKIRYWLVVLFVMLASSMQAQQESGYKAMLGMGLTGAKAESAMGMTLNVETSQGYLLKNRLFLGGGAGADLAFGRIFEGKERRKGITMHFPLFGHTRAYLGSHDVRPYIDLKGGYVLGDLKGGLFRPGWGITLPVSKKVAVNFGLSYQLLVHRSDREQLYLADVLDDWVNSADRKIDSYLDGLLDKYLGNWAPLAGSLLDKYLGDQLSSAVILDYLGVDPNTILPRKLLLHTLTFTWGVEF